MSDTTRVMEILRAAQALASEYRAITGKPLGVTGEVAEYHAARLMGMTLAPPRTQGYDALRGGQRVQIEGRVLLPDRKPGQRVGAIKADAPCDVVMLVLMDAALEPLSIWEASMKDIRARIAEPGSKARARGALGVADFKRLSREVWTRD